MTNIKITCLDKIGNLLYFVKVLKSHTQLSLNECKEITDKIKTNPGQEFDIQIVTSISEFEKELREKIGETEIRVKDEEEDRQIKFIQLGFGDEQEMLSIITDKLSSDLSDDVRKYFLSSDKFTSEFRNMALYSNQRMKAIFYDFFSEFLTILTPQQINDLFNNIINKSEKNG